MHDIAAGETYQLTELEVALDHLWWTRAGGLYVSAQVFPEPSPQLPLEPGTAFDSMAYTARAEALAKESTLQCFVYTDLPVRNWDEWLDERRAHVFALSVVAGTGRLQLIGRPRDLMPAVHAHCPHPPFGGLDDFDASATVRIVVSPAHLTAAALCVLGAAAGPGRRGVEHQQARVSGAARRPRRAH